MAQAGLFGGHPDGDLVDVVDGLGDLADLLLGPDPDRLHPDVEVAAFGGSQPLDRVGQPVLGDLDGPGRSRCSGPADGSRNQQKGQQKPTPSTTAISSALRSASRWAAELSSPL